MLSLHPVCRNVQDEALREIHTDAVGLDLKKRITLPEVCQEMAIVMVNEGWK